MTVPMIIDTDPGVDDAVALMLAAASPEVQVIAVTTGYGNAAVEVTTANALRLRKLAGLGEVPVAAGAGRPLVYPHRGRDSSWHGADGMGGRADLLPPLDGPPSPLGAVPLIATLLRRANRPVTLVAIGPLTNIALLLAVHPEVKPQIGRIVVMGGGFDAPEFNIGSDPEAARRVLVEEDVPATLVPLDLARRAVLGSTWLSELAESGPRCAAVAGLIEAHGTLRHAPVALHDPLAVLEAAVPGTLRTTPMALHVVCNQVADRGVVRERTSGPVVQVATDADMRSITATILHRLRRLH